MFTDDMLISDVLAAHPEAASVFERHGLACAMCLAAGMESLSAVAAVHDVSLDVIMCDLNALEPEVASTNEGE